MDAFWRAPQAAAAQAAAVYALYRLNARQDQQLLASLAEQPALVETERVADDHEPGLENAPAAPGEPYVQPDPPRPAPADRDRPAQQRLDQLARWRRQPSRSQLQAQRRGLLLDRVWPAATLD